MRQKNLPSSSALKPSPPGRKHSPQARRQRSFKAQSLSRLVPRVLKAGLGAKGSLEADLLLHWKDIVGAEHAQWTVPVKISYANRKMRRQGSLEVACTPAYAPFAQMAQGELVAAVNQFLGHGRIEKIKLKQSFDPKSGQSRTTVTTRGVQPPAYAVEQRRERRQNEDLNASLETLRRSLERRDKRD